MSDAYTEDQYATHPHPDPLPAGEGVWVDESGLFGRETKGEVVLVSRLARPRAGLDRLNPALSPEAITAAVDELTCDRSAMSLEAKIKVACAWPCEHVGELQP